MKLIKPKFWDYKKPNALSYFLLPLTLPIIINNFYIKLKRNKKKENKIKTICIGNIYIGGTAKTPLSIKINQILNRLNFRSGIIKKFYKNQIDEQKLLSDKGKLYCFSKRKDALREAIKDNIDVAVFDDGLQDSSINYDLRFVCFNNIKWIGNGLLIPAGPLRNKIQCIKDYDAVFVNGNGENSTNIKILIKKYNQNIRIFETYYKPIDIHKFNNKERYLIFSGIGNPDIFKETLLKNNLNVVKEFKFPDHYTYTEKDIRSIKLYAHNLNAKILTTEKDYVRLSKDNSNGIEFLQIELIIKQENELINFIKIKI
tara:strand:+ start:653 stop:1594 length:942 start_codon:yes stop_codon:yes gene_type:complete